MSGIEILGVGKGPARTFEVEWRQLICTRREWKIQMREKILSMSWDIYGWNGI